MTNWIRGMMDRYSKFIYFQGKDGEWYWHLQAKNGETVAQSEAYHEKGEALRGIEDASRAFHQTMEVSEDAIQEGMGSFLPTNEDASPETDPPAS